MLARGRSFDGAFRRLAPLARDPIAAQSRLDARRNGAPAIRPDGLADLFLAGGYLAGPLPDCIESAVRSGKSAARACLENGG